MAIAGAGFMLPMQIITLGRSAKPFHFIGLGGAGTNLLRCFYEKGFSGRFTIINDTRSIDFPQDIGFIRFAPPDPDKVLFGQKFYEMSDLMKDRGIPQDIRDLMGGDEKYIILSGLGRYTGSYLSMKLSGLLHQQNKDHMVVTTLPFSFEGKHTGNIALYAHERIRSTSRHLTLDLNNIIKEFGNVRVQNAFRVADEKIVKLFLRLEQN